MKERKKGKSKRQKDAKKGGKKERMKDIEVMKNIGTKIKERKHYLEDLLFWIPQFHDPGDFCVSEAQMSGKVSKAIIHNPAL